MFASRESAGGSTSYPQRVLFVSNRFEVDPGAGGTETLTADLATALSRRQVSVTWLAAGNDGQVPPPAPGEVTRIRVTAPPASTPSASWQSREDSVARAVEDALLDMAPFDVVHVTHFSRLGLAFLDIESLRGAKAVATLTDYTAVCGDYQLINRRSGKQCAPPVAPDDCAQCLGTGATPDRIDAAEYDAWRSRNLRLFNSRFTALWAQTPHQRSRLVDAGIDENRFVSAHARYAIPRRWRRQPVGSGIPTLLFLGRASREKGLHLLLQAFRAWPGSARLRVVTTADDAEYERWSRAEAAPDPRVEWLDPVPRENLGDLLNAASALVIPSQWDENHPIVMHYAMALGVPVLASAVPSLAHLADLADVRLVEDHVRPESWAKAFDELLDRPGAGIDRTAEFGSAFDDLVQETIRMYGDRDNADSAR